MGLADDIRGLRERALAELDAAHDYYADTQTAWRMVVQAVAAGEAFTTINPATGTARTLSDLAAKSRGYVARELAEATFMSFLGIFESFLFDLMRLWLRAYPGAAGNKTLTFGEVLDAGTFDGVVDLVVEREVRAVLYQRPAAWFEDLRRRFGVAGPGADDVGRFAEAKATRDAIAHSLGVAEETYAAKAGAFSRFQPGERVEVPEDYHREVWALVRRMVADLADATAAKA